MNGVLAISRDALAAIAPQYEAMRQAIAKVERVDEIKQIADTATAAEAYYRMSCDMENELGASRIRARAERRMGELLRQMRENGERRGPGDPDTSRGATSLSDLGIPRDRASRAMQLADVPEQEFEDALAEPGVAKPRGILNARRKKNDVTPPWPVPIEHTLDLWGDVRDLGAKIEKKELPPLALWRTNLQPFHIAELRKFIPLIVEYLTAIHQEIERESA